MTLKIGERWFDFARIDDDITLIWEPHVDPFIRCNIWHVRGRERDMMVDSGLGIASLKDAARGLLDKPLAAVATHSHYDHIGGFHEFEERIAHRSEEEELADPRGFASLTAADLNDRVVDAIRASGYELPEALVTALPHDGYDIADYRLRPAPATRLVDEGDVIDLGDRVSRCCICRAIRRVAWGFGRPPAAPCSPATRSTTAPCSMSCPAPTSRAMSRP